MKISTSLVSAALFAFALPIIELSGQNIPVVKKAANDIEPAASFSKLFEEQQLRQKMKEDGLTDPVINTLIQQRKALEAQGRKVTWSHYGKGGENPKPNAACSDIGVENGWGAWQGSIGSNSGGNPGLFQAPGTPVAPRFNITSGSGIDPCTPGINAGDPAIPVVAPGFGNASIQLGEPQVTGCMTEQLTYPLTVTAADTDFVYSYALVFYDPSSGHAAQEKPFADFLILDQNGDTIPCSFVHYVSDPFLPGWYTANSTCNGSPSTFYKPWTSVGVNLKNYVGQTLTIVITNGDCVFCGHYAHSYWDFLCGSISIGGCNGSSSTVCGPTSDPANPYSYQWYKNGSIIPGGNGQCQGVTPNSGDSYVVQVMPASGCNFNMSYVASTGTLQSLFTYSTSVNNVQFTDLSTAANQWTWDFGDGNYATNQNPSHTYASPGTYIACLIVSDGACSDTICKTINIAAVGLNDLDISGSVSVFPNPASGQVFLDFSGKNFGAAEITLSNILGEKLNETKMAASGLKMLDVSGYPEGVYFVKIDTNAGSVTKKIIVYR